MQPPSWPDVPALVTEWLAQANDLADSEPVELPERLALSHAAFEQIHPFLDGNGRVGRLVLNLLLVRLGYPPAIIYKRERADYLRGLRRADQADPGALGELLARAILDNLYKFVVPAVAGPARLVLLLRHRPRCIPRVRGSRRDEHPRRPGAFAIQGSPRGEVLAQIRSPRLCSLAHGGPKNAREGEPPT
jgi:hypothetical protein